jgi:hypothetical protein
MSVIAIFQQLQALSQVILDRARPASYLRYGDITPVIGKQRSLGKNLGYGVTSQTTPQPPLPPVQSPMPPSNVVP